MSLPLIVIIELGSQYTLLIERICRELGVRAIILNPERASAWFKSHPVNAVILSGGSASVYDAGAPQPPEEVLSLKRLDGSPAPVLGICYGMQWMAKHLGGTVRASPDHREYGETKISVLSGDDPLFGGTSLEQIVWMSHGDSVVAVPAGFSVLAKTQNGAIAAMGNGTSAWGVQFHPEVPHTAEGKKIFANFLYTIAGCERDWKPTAIIAAIGDRIRTGLKGDDAKAIIGFSGGVDSTTIAKIASGVLGERLLALTIDGGQLREGEIDEIRRHAACAGVSPKIIDACEEFAAALAGVTDAEEKRKRFRGGYVRLFLRAAREFGAAAVIQGTLAPDRIESGDTGGAVIKTHHNVGLDMGDLTQLHPVDHLFKYEIRAVAQDIGLPESVWRRQPFPGPGLFLRVVGTPATPKTLNIVRWADARVREILVQHGLYGGVSQLVVALLGIKTVGVKGDGRVYGWSIAVRAVETVDFMTARCVHFPDPVEDEITKAITAHPDIVRAIFDFTQKPPATTEFE